MRLPVSARLECCAGLVPQGARAADIGADHGYLGISLLLNGRAEFVHASELREQPLRRAMENALRFGVPAKPIRRRFDDAVIARLEALRWWDWDEERIRRSIPAIQAGDVDALEGMA